jgi:uracil-DNA glycosylase family 4
LSGFLEVLEETRKAVPLLPSCGKCGLSKMCRSPFMKPFGRFKRKILVLGESPGESEDDQGKPFVGRTGQLLRETLAKFDTDLDRDCITTNSLICRPPNNEIKNPKAVEWCRPNLAKTIRETRPELIILLGAVAVKSLITGWLWPDSGGSGKQQDGEKNVRGKWCGWRIPCQELNAWLCPTWHPSFVARSEREKNGKLIRLLWERDLEASLKLEGHPWRKAPDYASRVEVTLDDREAAKGIGELMGTGRPLAVDIESGAKKPQASFIHSCAVSDGRRSIAYPWHGKAIEATEELLKSRTPLIGGNIKFEQTWFLEKLGLAPRTWLWDTVNDAHLIDNRPGISSVDFQAWVLLGQAQWDGHAKKYLKSKHGWGNEVNRIKQADLRKVLQYGGLDALLEWKIAQRQMAILGREILS